MIDSHAHLEMAPFDPDRERVLERAARAGVHTIVSLALLDQDDSYRKAFELVDSHPGLYTAVGCHPHDARRFDEQVEATLRALASHRRVLAIGEIGLDYHYDHSPRQVQQDAFRRQIRVARELGLPVIVHQREAEADLIRLLDEEGVPPRGGILHSFTASEATARAVLDRGFLISFSGILTFGSAGPLREVARRVPLDRLLVETDAPYLAPVPHRGKRNEPAFVWETARVLAELHGIAPAELEEVTDGSFRRFFFL